MKYNLKRAKLKQENETNSIVRYAYSYLIESYESTIMFLEAEILSTLDSLDATIFEFNSAASKVEPGEFSDRQWMLDNRKVFNHGLAPSDYKVNLGE